MHFKDTTTIFFKSNNIISKVPWKSDIHHYGLTFHFNISNSPKCDVVSNDAECNDVISNSPKCNVISNAPECNDVISNSPKCNVISNASECNDVISNSFKCDDVVSNSFKCDGIIENSSNSNNKYIKIGSNQCYNYKFKLNTENVTNLIFEYFYNNVSRYDILYDTSTIDYLISVNLDASSYLKIYIGESNRGIVNIYNIKRYESDNLGTFRHSRHGTYDKIYIINLEHRKDRKDSVIKQLEKEGITNYEFINAVNGTDSAISKMFKNIRKNGSKIGTPGHLGCLLSHKKVLLKAKEDNVEQFMILEDDVILKDGFMNRLNSILLPDWECIYLSAPLEEKKLFFNGWAKHSKYCTTHAMIIKASIIDYLLELLKNCDDYIDRIYSHTLQKHKKTYLLDDIVLTSDANDTNTSRKNKKFLYMIKNYNP